MRFRPRRVRPLDVCLETAAADERARAQPQLRHELPHQRRLADARLADSATTHRRRTPACPRSSRTSLRAPPCGRRTAGCSAADRARRAACRPPTPPCRAHALGVEQRAVGRGEQRLESDAPCSAQSRRRWRASPTSWSLATRAAGSAWRASRRRSRSATSRAWSTDAAAAAPRIRRPRSGRRTGPAADARASTPPRGAARSSPVRWP